MYRVTILFLGLFFIYACTPVDPVYQETKQIISDHYTYEYEDRCRVSIYLAGKVEFFDIRDAMFCSVDFTIDSLTIVSDDERMVHFSVVMNADRKIIQKWLRAWREFEERVETIRPVRVPDPNHGLIWVYTDNSDGFIFLEPYSQDPKGVKSTPQWEALTVLYDNIVELRDQRSRVIEARSTCLKIVDGEWEIADEE